MSEFRRRAVFLDVDGTILQDGHYIPASAAAAIRAARTAGHLVFLSTGRGMRELRGPVWDLGFDGAVTNGGGFAAVGDERVTARLLSADSVADLEQRFARQGVHWYFQTYDRLFASPGLADLMTQVLEADRARARARGIDPDGPLFHSAGGKMFDDPALFDRSEAAKAVILSDDADAIAAVIADVQDEYAVVSGTIPLPLGSSAEVAALGVNKGAAIQDVLARVGIDPADAIGVGDNWNDVEMFEVCGVSVAMGNAVPEVQALADQVTTAIDADGLHNAFLRNNLL